MTDRVTPATIAAALIAREEMPPEKGDPGPEGKAGPVGLTGPQGVPGTDGRDGKDGPQGKPGPRGLKGDKGDKGDKGEKGDTGPEGPPGKDAVTPIMGGGRRHQQPAGGIAGVTVKQSGTPVGTPNQVTAINFTGGATVTNAGGGQVDVASGGIPALTIVRVGGTAPMPPVALMLAPDTRPR
jgi:hypothetical protein